MEFAMNIDLNNLDLQVEFQGHDANDGGGGNEFDWETESNDSANAPAISPTENEPEPVLQCQACNSISIEENRSQRTSYPWVHPCRCEDIWFHQVCLVFRLHQTSNFKCPICNFTYRYIPSPDFSAKAIFNIREYFNGLLKFCAPIGVAFKWVASAYFGYLTIKYLPIAIKSLFCVGTDLPFWELQSESSLLKWEILSAYMMVNLSYLTCRFVKPNMATFACFIFRLQHPLTIRFEITTPNPPFISPGIVGLPVVVGATIALSVVILRPADLRTTITTIFWASMIYQLFAIVDYASIEFGFIYSLLEERHSERVLSYHHQDQETNTEILNPVLNGDKGLRGYDPAWALLGFPYNPAAIRRWVHW